MTTAVWFRKNLRVHDNAALTQACADESVLPLYCVDPAWATPGIVGPNRCRFLLDEIRAVLRFFSRFRSVLSARNSVSYTHLTLPTIRPV